MKRQPHELDRLQDLISAIGIHAGYFASHVGQTLPTLQPAAAAFNSAVEQHLNAAMTAIAKDQLVGNGRVGSVVFTMFPDDCEMAQGYRSQLPLTFEDSISIAEVLSFLNDKLGDLAMSHDKYQTVVWPDVTDELLKPLYVSEDHRPSNVSAIIQIGEQPVDGLYTARSAGYYSAESFSWLLLKLEDENTSYLFVPAARGGSPFLLTYVELEDRYVRHDDFKYIKRETFLTAFDNLVAERGVTLPERISMSEVGERIGAALLEIGADAAKSLGAGVLAAPQYWWGSRFVKYTNIVNEDEKEIRQFQFVVRGTQLTVMLQDETVQRVSSVCSDQRHPWDLYPAIAQHRFVDAVLALIKQESDKFNALQEAGSPPGDSVTT